MLRVSPEVRLKGSAPPTLIPAHPYVPPQPLRKPSPEDSRSYHRSSLSPPHLHSSDDDDDESKKHICTTCNKRFRRPSSLNIHRNTHTGATPYPCSFPGCSKEFNVKSNMLRHYRSHTSPLPSQSSTSRSNLQIVNPYPQIHTSPGASSTEEQDQARGQNYRSQPSHDSTWMERERFYQHRYSMGDVRLAGGGEEREHESMR
ncbi:hypothetical protein IW261DRAFT_1346481 [Armillaria novae-zelandiae]|uniref:C2H2-type domain-containing protein n=1 Tax=Armillaria novae-zelandiae TaxID=153914 RepID=A0AA39NJ88_9AGAR|nr:hypothetical protein IW261DRAFT_1346481 [Armillaria novae-zelandiae]